MSNDDTSLTFGRVNPAASDVAEIIARHHAQMRAQSPPESCHVKTGEELVAADGMMFALRENGVALAVGAMVPLTPGHFELKSMHVVDAARGRGMGRELLARMMAHAQRDGATQISLETGADHHHEAARALYRGAGFKECLPFGDYTADTRSTFMTRSL